ncbi:2OG-Fe(II) oxygenase [Chryseobacterium sp. RG1]|uniref:2OG-Fe(II) oxygenase n=1 Tax=Chryseobacterium tagetis TaxID=2801334 RepID=A0ABS7ZZK2_9FLAO|nr:2OG-Fe(II) oxygenase [Chryseobacterium tagetis]MCA6067166.1 2OG-Fe(II) oxygenase [Chryseobacterium tagetis]
MKKKELHPEIFIIENFLTAEECSEYIKKAEQETFEEAKINMHGRQVMSKGIRNNERLMIFDENMAEDLFQRAKDLLPEEAGIYNLSGFNEMFRVYKYLPGQLFRMHRDGSYVRNEDEVSFYTFLIYLNDDFEGGETEFENLFTITPKKGSALVFYHPLRHEGKTLISGLKYVLRTDVMYSKK